MYPLDLSVAAGARRAQFSSSAILTGTKIPKPPAYDCAYNSKTVHAGAPAATDKSNGYIEYEALHHHLDMCSYVETQAITHIAFSLPCRLC